MNKKQIFEIKIAPLVAEIFDICDKYGIAMISTYSLQSPDNPGLFASTHHADEVGNMPDNMSKALLTVYGKPEEGEEDQTENNTEIVSKEAVDLLASILKFARADASKVTH